MERGLLQTLIDLGITFTKCGKLSEASKAHRFRFRISCDEQQAFTFCRRLSSKPGVLCFPKQFDEFQEITILSTQTVSTLQAATSLLEQESWKCEFFDQEITSYFEVGVALHFSVISRLASEKRFFVLGDDSTTLFLMVDIFSLPPLTTTRVDSLYFHQQVFADGRIIWTCNPHVLHFKPVSIPEFFVNEKAHQRYIAKESLSFYGLREECPVYCLPSFKLGNVVGVYQSLPMTAQMNSSELSEFWMTKYGISLPSKNRMGPYVEVDFLENIAFYPSCCVFEIFPALNLYQTRQRGHFIFKSFFEAVQACCGTYFSFESILSDSLSHQISFSSSFSSAKNLPKNSPMNIAVRKRDFSLPQRTQSSVDPKSPDNLSLTTPSSKPVGKPHMGDVRKISFQKRTTQPQSQCGLLKRKAHDEPVASTTKGSAQKEGELKKKKTSSDQEIQANLKSLTISKVRKGSQKNDTKQSQNQSKKGCQKGEASSLSPQKIELAEVLNGSIEKRKLLELKAFCRANNLRVGRTKTDAIKSISEFLKNKKQPN